MKKGVRILYDFIDQKVEEEIMEDRYNTYSKLRRKPLAFEDEDYVKDRCERKKRAKRRTRRNKWRK